MPTPDHTFTATQIITHALSGRVPIGHDTRSTQLVYSTLSNRPPPVNQHDTRSTQIVVMVLAKRFQPSDDFQYGLPLVGVLR
jgi:hypothetical protein